MASLDRRMPSLAQRAGVWEVGFCIVNGVKTIIKAVFLGAFFLGCCGGFIGAIAALVIWPTSNLGTPMGGIEGAAIGILIGVLIGFIVGLRRVFTEKRKLKNPR
jgi:hypothetical protein